MDNDNSSYQLEQNDKKENINKYGKIKNKEEKNTFPYLIILFCFLFFLFLLYIYYMLYNNKSNIAIQFNKYTFNIASKENKYYNITFENFHSFFKVFGSLNNGHCNEIYEKLYYLNDFKKNEFFSFYNSIDEIYKKIISIIIKNNNSKILIDEYNQINIIIPSEEVKSNVINLTIPLKVNNSRQMEEQLLNTFYFFNEGNNKLKNELKCFNEKNNIFKDEIIKYLDILDILNDQGSTLINLIDNNKILNLSSIIKNNIDNYKLIINWIKEKTNKNLIKFELIFKMSEKGYSSKDFHKFCDDQGPTLLLIETKDNKIFGGFTPLNWKTSEDIERLIDSSDSTFLFSLSLRKKYDMINKLDYAIRNAKDFGPIFGNFDLSLSSNMTRGGTFANNLCNFFGNNYLELTGDNGVTTDFEVKEFEVYKVIY